jgi:hypothetical protein
MIKARHVGVVVGSTAVPFGYFEPAAMGFHVDHPRGPAQVMTTIVLIFC